MSSAFRVGKILCAPWVVVLLLGLQMTIFCLHSCSLHWHMQQQQQQLELLGLKQVHPHEEGWEIGSRPQRPIPCPEAPPHRHRSQVFPAAAWPVFLPPNQLLCWVLFSIYVRTLPAPHCLSFICCSPVGCVGMGLKVQDVGMFGHKHSRIQVYERYLKKSIWNHHNILQLNGVDQGLAQLQLYLTTVIL